MDDLTAESEKPEGLEKTDSLGWRTGLCFLSSAAAIR
jgi:hypothetical protein